MVPERTRRDFLGLTFYSCLTHGDLVLEIGDAVSLVSSGKPLSTEGDYKVGAVAFGRVNSRKAGLVRSMLSGKTTRDRSGWRHAGTTR